MYKKALARSRRVEQAGGEPGKKCVYRTGQGRGGQRQWKRAGRKGAKEKPEEVREPKERGARRASGAPDAAERAPASIPIVRRYSPLGARRPRPCASRGDGISPICICQRNSSIKILIASLPWAYIPTPAHFYIRSRKRFPA